MNKNLDKNILGIQFLNEKVRRLFLKLYSTKNRQIDKNGEKKMKNKKLKNKKMNCKNNNKKNTGMKNAVVGYCKNILCVKRKESKELKEREREREGEKFLFST